MFLFFFFMKSYKRTMPKVSIPRSKQITCLAFVRNICFNSPKKKDNLQGTEGISTQSTIIDSGR